MRAIELKKISVGDIIFLDGRWSVICDYKDGEWHVLSIEITPKLSMCREFGVEVFAASSFVHGNAPMPITAGRICDPLDTVFYETTVSRVTSGNTRWEEVNVIDYGYYCGQKDGFIILFDKTKRKRIFSRADKPVHNVFFFAETQVKNERLEQYLNDAKNAVKCNKNDKKCIENERILQGNPSEGLP